MNEELTRIFDEADLQEKKQLLYVLTHEEQIEDMTAQVQTDFIEYIRSWWIQNGQPRGFEFLTAAQRELAEDCGW